MFGGSISFQSQYLSERISYGPNFRIKDAIHEQYTDFRGHYRGGGHSPISSKYGLAADQVLEWEVITGAGDFVKASPTENSDLYWALSG